MHETSSIFFAVFAGLIINSAITGVVSLSFCTRVLRDLGVIVIHQNPVRRALQVIDSHCHLQSLTAEESAAAIEERVLATRGEVMIGLAGLLLGAALLAAAILATGDPAVATSLDSFRASQTDAVLQQPDPRAGNRGHP